MKTKIVSISMGVLGLALMGILVLDGRADGQSSTNAADTNAPALANTNPFTPPSTDPTVLPPAPPVVAAPQTAPPAQQPIAPPAQFATQPEVTLSKGAADVAKFAQGGIGEDVMLSYVANSSAKFNLGSDQIVYLNDLGISGSVIKAMIQHDAGLNAMSQAYAQTQYQPTPPPVTPPPPAPTDYATNPPPAPSVDYGTPMPTYDPSVSVVPDDADYFYGSLSPYGTWFYMAGEGLCWQPTVWVSNQNWRPYCDRGRWIYSDCGWYWQSDYSWGWAAFHYGRWLQDARYGWIWKPDHVWSPAWVSWRASRNYCGWAPLPPAAHYLPGTGLVSTHAARNGELEFGLKPHQYTFIPIAQMTDYNPARYASRPYEADEISSKTSYITRMSERDHHMIAAGLDPGRVSSLAGTEVRRAEIHEVANAQVGAQSERLTKKGGSLVIYRSSLPTPRARVNSGNGYAPASRPGFGPRPTSKADVEAYPAGSLVVRGSTRVTTPERPLPNMNFSYLAHQPQPAVVRPEPENTYTYNQNVWTHETPAHSDGGYSVIGGFAHRNNGGSSVSVTTIGGGGHTAVERSGGSSPYTVYSSRSTHVGSAGENNFHNIPGHFTAGERINSSGTQHGWENSSPHTYVDGSEFHNHPESHPTFESHPVAESHPSYSAPQSHSSGSSSSNGNSKR